MGMDFGISRSEGDGKCRTFIDLTGYRDITSKTCDLLVDQIKTNALTVLVVMEALVQFENTVAYLVHIKARTIVRIYQCLDAIILVAGY